MLSLSLSLTISRPIWTQDESPPGDDELPPSWTAFTHNLPATPSSTNYGAAVTAGANNTKGTVVDLLGAALTHDVELLYIGLHTFRLSGSNGSALLDIMIDAAGGTNWSVLIPNLLAGWTNSTNMNNGIGTARNYYFPIQIPSGATIGARAQTALGSDLNGNVVIYAVGGNTNPGGWWAGTSVEAIGIDAANSIGQMHTCGNSGAYSSWTSLGDVTSAAGSAVQFAAQGENDDTAANTLCHHFEFGAASAMIGPPIFMGTQFTESSAMLPNLPIFRTIAAGTQLQVRGKGSGTSVPIDVAAYVVS
jgi:hypothetical protein